MAQAMVAVPLQQCGMSLSSVTVPVVVAFSAHAGVSLLACPASGVRDSNPGPALTFDLHFSE